jgi:hypothetical protein
MYVQNVQCKVLLIKAQLGVREGPQSSKNKKLVPNKAAVERCGGEKSSIKRPNYGNRKSVNLIFFAF